MQRRIAQSDDNSPNSACKDRVGTGRRLAGVAARFESHKERGRRGKLGAGFRIGVSILEIGERVDFGMRPAKPFMPALAQQISAGIHKDRSDGGIGFDKSEALPGQRDGPAHDVFVGGKRKRN